MTQTATVDAVMRTLADPTRRAVFERIVSANEITVVELTRGSGVTQSAISQHLRSLRQAGLVADRQDGRNVHYRADPKGLAPLVDWMALYGVFWRDRFANLRTPVEGDRSMTLNSAVGAATRPYTQDIVVEEVFPHAPETIWKALTTGALIARWLPMPMTGFAPETGTRFTLQTTPGGSWDGIIHCQVLEVIPNEHFAYAWKSGHAENVGYGARLDTVVTWTLARAANGTRLRLVHSGFVLPKNETAFNGMSDGWIKVVRAVDAIAAEQVVSDTTR